MLEMSGESPESEVHVAQDRSIFAPVLESPKIVQPSACRVSELLSEAGVFQKCSQKYPPIGTYGRQNRHWRVDCFT